MAVPIGGYRPVSGTIMSYGPHEYVLTNIRAQALEAAEIASRSSYRSQPRNYGDLSLEMAAELTGAVTVPYIGTAYNLAAGTPLFIETMRADSVKYAGLVGNGSTATSINILNSSVANLYVGAGLEINGVQRPITAIGAANSGGAGLTAVTIGGGGYPAAPLIGALALLKGNDFANPHLSAVLRVTDKYGSHTINEQRYQVDRNTGIIRFLPTAGTLTDSIWHPEAQVGKPYYFGKRIPITILPPPARPLASVAPGGEELGNPIDPIAATAPPTTLTTFTGLVPPNGQFSNIQITSPPGVTFEVDINGAKVAIVGNGGTITIPFFDPDHTNDDLKANSKIDPDIYIQRFLKVGDNHISIKATRGTNAVAGTGIRVEGTFNGVSLSTANSPTSTLTDDWSTSQHSILGIAGRVDFDLGDRIAIEDAADRFQQSNAVLESLTTLLAGTDINQLTSILSVIK